MDVECATQTFDKVPIFTARIFMVHILLAGSFVLSLINSMGENQLQLGEVGDNPPADCMLAAVILVGIHLILYPVAALILMLQVVGVLPHINTENGSLAFHYGAILIGCTLNE